MFKHFTRGLVAALALFAVTPQLHAQAFSDYVENAIVDELLRGQNFTPPTTIYVGLSTTACSDSSVRD